MSADKKPSKQLLHLVFGGELTSLEGIEFLCEVEALFGVRIKDLDWWVYETPTLAAVADYLVDLARKQHAAGHPAG